MIGMWKKLSLMFEIVLFISFTLAKASPSDRVNHIILSGKEAKKIVDASNRLIQCDKFDSWKPKNSVIHAMKKKLIQRLSNDKCAISNKMEHLKIQIIPIVLNGKKYILINGFDDATFNSIKALPPEFKISWKRNAVVVDGGGCGNFKALYVCEEDVISGIAYNFPE